MFINPAAQAQNPNPVHTRPVNSTGPAPLEKYKTGRMKTDTVSGYPQTFTVHQLYKDTTEVVFILNNRVVNKWEVEKALEENKDTYKMLFFEQKILMNGFKNSAYGIDKKWVIYVETL